MGPLDNWYTVYHDEKDVHNHGWKAKDNWIVWSNRYTQAFDLQGTLRYPRMCAAVSDILEPDISYYLGTS